MNQFFTPITSSINPDIVLEDIELELVRAACTRKQLAKGDFLLTHGQRCRHTFFIERGLVRQYSIDPKGKEHILFFAAEGAFLDNIEAVHFNAPSSYFIQAIEPTDVLLISEEALAELAKRLHHFSDLHSRLLYQHIMHQHKRITQLQSSSAEDRYMAFVRDYPEMMLRVPQLMIASYLGITPESLSRVRKALADKNFKR